MMKINMINIICKIYNKIKFYAINTYLLYIVNDEHTRNVNKWYKDTKIVDIRFLLNLDSNSVVVDLGGYHGEWAHEIYIRYQPILYIYEPVPHFYEIIKLKFNHCNNVFVMNYGLSDKSADAMISLNADGSSLYNINNKCIPIKLVDIIQELDSRNINSIELIKINIEGAEYDLLDKIIECDKIHMFNNLQIQFHDFIENAQARRDKIRKKLSITHELIYDYPFVWEGWVRKVS